MQVSISIIQMKRTGSTLRIIGRRAAQQKGKVRPFQVGKKKQTDTK